MKHTFKDSENDQEEEKNQKSRDTGRHHHFLSTTGDTYLALLIPTLLLTCSLEKILGILAYRNQLTDQRE